MNENGVIGMLTAIALVMMGASLLLAFGRLATGPTLPDRIVATDLINILAVGLIVVGAGVRGESAFLDAAIVIALIGFVATLAYARYIERERR